MYEVVSNQKPFDWNLDFSSDRYAYYKIYEMGLMRNFQKKGIPIQLWTVNELNLLKDLINSDIQSIVTDVPSQILGK